MDKYELYCETESAVKCVIASSVPTECPSASEHTVRSGSVHCTKQDILINDGTTKDLTLADYKQLRYNEIDGKTLALISVGFTYDSQTFSLSGSAQMNWATLKTNTSAFTWPVEISTKDNNAYSLAEANLTAFWTAGRDAVQDHLDDGRTLKKSVFDAANEAAVDAVVDSR